MRWLKPSKKKPPKSKTIKNNKKQKKKNKQKKRKKERTTNKTQKYQKKSFSVMSHFYLFLEGVQNSLFLTTWLKTRAPPKHYKNRGFRDQIFEKQLCITKRPPPDSKNPNPEIPVIIFFVLFFSFNNKKHKNALKPLFFVF